MESFLQSVPLLPLMLKPGKTQEFPIVLSGCKRLVLGELIYRNSRQPDLITSCAVHINGQTIDYQKSQESAKTYYINGQKNSVVEIEIDPETNVNVTLNVS